MNALRRDQNLQNRTAASEQAKVADFEATKIQCSQLDSLKTRTAKDQQSGERSATLLKNVQESEQTEPPHLPLHQTCPRWPLNF